MGHQCIAVTGSLTDQENQLLGKVKALDPVDTLEVRGLDIKTPVHKVTFNGVTHFIAFFGSRKVAELKAVEDVVLKELFVNIFTQNEPDVLVTYGGLNSCFFAGLYAQANGCRSVLYAASPTHTKASHFLHVEQVFTTSYALKERMVQVTDRPITVLSSLVRSTDVVCENRKPEFITFINPILEKGLALVVALIQASHVQNKPYKFLIVEARGKRDTVLEAYPILGELNTVFFANNTDAIRLIYERTTLVLYPSVWFESAGRVPIEANANGIPVLASRVGGIPEVLDGAGFLFDPPKRMLDNFAAPPPESYVTQWLETIDRLHNEAAFMDDAVARAEAAAERYSLRSLAETFISTLS